MATTVDSRQQRVVKKTMLLQPFFTVAIKSNINV